MEFFNQILGILENNSMLIEVIGLIVAVFAAVWAVFKFFYKPSKDKNNKPNSQHSSVSKSTRNINTGKISGDKAVIAGGDVNITNNISKEQIDLLLQTYKQGLSDGKGFTDENLTNETPNRLMTNLLEENKKKDINISELQETIKKQAKKITEILADENISDEIKNHIERGDIVTAEKLVDSHYQEKIQPGKKEFAQQLYERGQVKELRLKYPEALTAFAEAIALEPENSTYLNAAGSVARNLAQYDQAKSYYEKALDIAIKILGEEHPHVATYRNNLGLAWHDKGEYDRAIGYYEQALASGIKTFGEEHPNVAIRRNNLGLAWQAKGEYNKAIEYYEQALTSDIKTFGEEHPDVATMRNNLGSAWHDKGEYDKAIEYYEQALTSDIKTFGEEHPDVATDRNNLGLAWQAKGEFDKAIGYFEQALKIRKKMLGANHPHTISVRSSLRIAKQQAGK